MADLDGRVSSLEQWRAAVDSELTYFRRGLDDLREQSVSQTAEIRRTIELQADRSIQAGIQAREEARKDAEAEWKRKQWFYGKLFGLVGTLLTLAGGGGGAAWYMSHDEPQPRAEQVTEADVGSSATADGEP